MVKLYPFLLIVLLPTFIHAQSASIKMIDEVCDGKIFTRCEQIPSLKISKEAFEDSLKTFLKEKKALKRDFRITYRFIVTKDSQIWELSRVDGDMPKENVAREALLFYAHLWMCGVQNTYKVCAYAKAQIEFAKENLSVTISQ